MSEPGQAIERRSMMPAAIPSDDEIRRLFRVADALAQSRMFKSVTKAEEAFAKMIVGRDLGMTPAQSMQGLHIVQGGVMVHYATLGHFIRSRREEGYDFRPGWLKEDDAPVEGGPPPGVVAPRIVTVWADEEDPEDMRPVVGAIIDFTIHGKSVGLSRYTVQDAEEAGLIKADKRDSAWNAARRNMLRARCMSNGVKWFVPEVLGGLPVYVEGEIVQEKQDLSAGSGSGEAQGLDLGPGVEFVIQYATDLGHAGLSDRAAVEIAVGNRSPNIVNEWVRQARQELERFAAEKAAAAEAEATDTGTEPPDAEVVSEEPQDAVEAADTDAPPAPATETERELEGSVLLRRYSALRDQWDPAETDSDHAEQIGAEMDHIAERLAALGIEIPEEGA